MHAFFIPAAESAEQAERVWSSVHQHLSQELGPIRARRILSVSFSHNGKPMKAVAGETFPAVGEPVIAIFKSATTPLYLVCTPNRGVLGGMSWHVGKEGAHAVDFQPAAQE